MPGQCCTVGTATPRGPSLQVAGGCGGDWRQFPLGCTTASSTVSGCATLPTVCTPWPGEDTELLLCLQGHLLLPTWESLCGSLGSAEAFMRSWRGLGGSLGVSKILHSVLGGSGGSLGVNGDFLRVMEGLGRVSWDLHGILDAQEGPWETLGRSRALQVVLGAQASPKESTSAMAGGLFIPPLLEPQNLPEKPQSSPQ